MAGAAGTALAAAATGGELMQPLDHDGAAVFAHPQNFRDAPAAQMLGSLGFFLLPAPEAAEIGPPGTHTGSMNHIHFEGNTAGPGPLDRFHVCGPLVADLARAGNHHAGPGRSVKTPVNTETAMVL